MVYKRTDRPTWFLAVPTPHGWVKRSTGTTHKPTAMAMERMLEVLGPKGRREWDLLGAVVDGTLSLGALFDAYRENDLEGLRGRLEEVDLAEHVERWQEWLMDRIRPDTRTHYLAHLRTLMPEGGVFPRAEFTAPAIARWLAERSTLPQKRKASTRAKSRRRPDPASRPITGSTRRKYLAAVQSFAGYLVQVGVLTTNPARDVAAPPPGRPRVVELVHQDVVRIVEHARKPYRALFALLYGAGVEISAALRCSDADVDVGRREVRARGTKAHARDRVVRVAEWAWPYLETHVRRLTPGERLFRGIDRWHAGDVHRETLTALELAPHRLHDARHFYAIRAIRAGTPYELVARQLGHANVQMVATVYGRYAPRSDERDRWERIAAELDPKRPTRSAEVPPVVPKTGAPNEESRQPGAGPRLPNSRGGTRTHDPGIMSAVL